MTTNEIPISLPAWVPAVNSEPAIFEVTKDGNKSTTPFARAPFRPGMHSQSKVFVNLNTGQMLTADELGAAYSGVKKFAPVASGSRGNLYKEPYLTELQERAELTLSSSMLAEHQAYAKDVFDEEEIEQAAQQTVVAEQFHFEALEAVEAAMEARSASDN
jgi:hypothetical protein